MKTKIIFLGDIDIDFPKEFEAIRAGNISEVVECCNSMKIPDVVGQGLKGTEILKLEGYTRFVIDPDMSILNADNRDIFEDRNMTGAFFTNYQSDDIIKFKHIYGGEIYGDFVLGILDTINKSNEYANYMQERDNVIY